MEIVSGFGWPCAARCDENFAASSFEKRSTAVSLFSPGCGSFHVASSGSTGRLIIMLRSSTLSLGALAEFATSALLTDELEKELSLPAEEQLNAMNEQMRKAVRGIRRIG